MSVEMVPVESSNLQEIGYDPETSTLYVGFLNGSRYAYKDVPEEIFEEFKGADSMGRFLHRRIKLGGFEYERIL